LLFDQLRREKNGLLRHYTAGAEPAARGVFPAVNLYETGEAYVLTAELPGVRREDMHVGFDGTTVTLRGERRVEHPTDEKVSAHRLERQSGSFRRTFELRVGIDVEKIEAVHRNGVLIVRLPKSPEHRPRQIPVQAG
jgi:HSP20 family protein